MRFELSHNSGILNICNSNYLIHKGYFLRNRKALKVLKNYYRIIITGYFMIHKKSIVFIGIAVFICLTGIMGAYYWYSSTYIQTTEVLPKSNQPTTLSKEIDPKNVLKNALGKSPIVDVAIIGSGPAGLSAALYCARLNLYTVTFDGKTPGGQLTKTSEVENWPGLPKMMGTDMIRGLREQAISFGVRMASDTIGRIDLSTWPFLLWTEEGKRVYALSIILATGANPRKLDVPGEDEYWGKGVTTCAICDAPFYKNCDVVVVGGGDSAVTEALQLVGYAKSITLLVRGDHMRATPIMQERLKDHKHIKVLYNTHITNIVGDGKSVTGIEVVTNDKDARMLPIDGVFLAIGHEPNTALVKHAVACDTYGYIVMHDRSQATSVPGVFAAGDVCDNEYRQAGVAAGDGIKAALDVEKFLRNHNVNQSFIDRISAHYFDPEEGKVQIDIPTITSNAEFDAEVTSTDPLVVVDFFAPYCPSCMQMLPVIESIAGHYKGKVKFVKVDTSQSLELAERFVVPSIPCMLVFERGNLIARNQEVMSRHELDKFIAQF